MRTAVKVVGVLSILAGLLSLLQRDVPGFVMLSALGAGLLIDPKPGPWGRGLKWTLLLVAFVLALVRIVSWGSG